MIHLLCCHMIFHCQTCPERGMASCMRVRFMGCYNDEPTLPHDFPPPNRSWKLYDLKLPHHVFLLVGFFPSTCHCLGRNQTWPLIIWLCGNNVYDYGVVVQWLQNDFSLTDTFWKQYGQNLSTKGFASSILSQDLPLFWKASNIISKQIWLWGSMFHGLAQWWTCFDTQFSTAKSRKLFGQNLPIPTMGFCFFYSFSWPTIILEGLKYHVQTHMFM